MELPAARGPLSAAVLDHVSERRAVDVASLPDLARAVGRVRDTAGEDDDLQLALACCYETHYGGFGEAGDAHEWDGSLLAVRAFLETAFEEWLRDAVDVPDPADLPIDLALRQLIDDHDGPSMSAYLMKHATIEQFREFVAVRSTYHLKEADPDTWVIPRLRGAAKAALVEIQTDEYGGGNAPQVHSAIFRRTMRALGLDDDEFAYWDDADGTSFAIVNAMSMFGLHRRLRGAAIGRLAAFEMTSTTPSRRLSNGLRRLGFDEDATHYYDVHVQADAVHAQLAAVDLCGSLVEAEPQLRDDVLFGAACCLHLDDAAGEAMFDRWAVPLERRWARGNPQPRASRRRTA